jgi:hypothetical protein
VSGMVFADAAHEDAGTIQGMPHMRTPNVRNRRRIMSFEAER